MKYIEINIDKYNNSPGSICIPKNIPERIKTELNKENKENIKYSYLDLIFGEIDQVFNEDQTYKEIKTCKYETAPDITLENEFLNYWNCKIDSFFIKNDKMPSSYSIPLNGDIYAIFSIEEEYIIAFNLTGIEIINYYKDFIKSNYDIKCQLQNFYKNLTKILVCKTSNFAELPHFNIILDGEIYLITLSFDIFKEKNDTHVYFKILLNQANTKEY